MVRRGTATRDAGTLDAGEPATLFTRALGRADEISVVADGRVVAHGTPVY
jgi:hypothetical protein